MPEHPLRALCCLLIAFLVVPHRAVAAEDQAFLASFAGNWSGKGAFRLSTAGSPVGVTCSFRSTATAASLKLDGTCRGMVVFSRRIVVTIQRSGGGYAGAYVGSTTGPAGIQGRRDGEALDLSIAWAADVNGDRQARMLVEKVGADAMRLRTIDRDPRTGRSVETSSIDLRR